MLGYICINTPRTLLLSKHISTQILNIGIKF